MKLTENVFAHVKKKINIMLSKASDFVYFCKDDGFKFALKQLYRLAPILELSPLALNTLLELTMKQ